MDLNWSRIGLSIQLLSKSLPFQHTLLKESTRMSPFSETLATPAHIATADKRWIGTDRVFGPTGEHKQKYRPGANCVGKPFKIFWYGHLSSASFWSKKCSFYCCRCSVWILSQYGWIMHLKITPLCFVLETWKAL